MTGAVGCDRADSYVPSVRPPVAKAVWNGGPTVAIETQVPAPCARCWNSTVAVSPSLVAEIVGEPRIAAPGSASVGVGAWLSTVTVTMLAVGSGGTVVGSFVFPARSVARTSIWTGPSATLELSHVAVGEVPVAITLPPTRNVYVSDGLASEAISEMVTELPLTIEPAVGAPTRAAGLVLSTTTRPPPPGWRSIDETLPTCR